MLTLTSLCSKNRADKIDLHAGRVTHLSEHANLTTPTRHFAKMKAPDRPMAGAFARVRLGDRDRQLSQVRQTKTHSAMRPPGRALSFLQNALFSPSKKGVVDANP